MTCESCGASLDASARFCSACGKSVRRDAAAPKDPLREALQRALPPNLSIVRPLGRGGMGAVYLARDEFLDREVAIKTLPAETDTNSSVRERFRREARIAAKLHHPNIVPLHTFGEAENILYYVMGYVRGETLAQRLEREGTIDPDDARRILAEIADALRYANLQSVIHRDLKPENILLDDSTRTSFLADFGIARVTGSGNLTRAGAVLGTPQYMAPEQAIGAPVDHRSDIYSLGVIGYRMLTGRFPVSGETFAEMLAQHAGRKPQPISGINPAVPQDLDDAIMRCLEKDPGDRWQSAAELRDALSGAKIEQPEGTPEMESVGVYLLLFLWIAALLTPFELFFWKQIDSGWRLFIELVQFTPFVGGMLFSVRVIEARQQKMAWKAIWRSLFHPPRWYPGWTPRWLRPHGDVWDRLPRAVRVYRVIFTVTILFGSLLTISIPVSVLSIDAKVIIRSAVLPWLAVLASGLVAAIAAERSLKKLGVETKERSIVMHYATWVVGKSRHPAIVKALSGATPRPDAPNATPASSPNPPAGTPNAATSDPANTPTRKEDFAAADQELPAVGTQESTIAKT